MKYHAVLVTFKKKQQNLKLSSSANYRWRFKGQKDLIPLLEAAVQCKHQCSGTVIANYLSLYPFILVVF